MQEEKDKSKLIGFSVLVSISSAIFMNLFLIKNFQSLLTIENFDYELARVSFPILLIVGFIHYAAMAIGLVASYRSQTVNSFRDLSKPVLAYLAYFVFIFDVGTFAWKNWS